MGITPTIILVRVSMNLSFDDTESFKEGAGSLHDRNSWVFINRHSFWDAGGYSHVNNVNKSANF